MSVKRHTVDGMIVLQNSGDVYEITNFSHDQPVEHRYAVVVGRDGDSVYCECPAFEYQDGPCKHMDAVEEFNNGGDDL